MTEERFVKNIKYIHLVCVLVCEEEGKKILDNLVKFFPNKEEDFEFFCFFTNFGMLEGYEKTYEEFYNNLVGIK